MALQIQENFKVAAPIDAVWAFLLTPENVVACMPGASLTEVIDEKSFVGTVKLKIGAVSAQYQGTIIYTERDKNAYSVKMLASGNERSGGTVSGTIITTLVSLPEGQGTEVKCVSSIDLTGRIMQVGRGMIEGVSAQIIKKYVTNARIMLEAPRRDESTSTTTTGVPETHQQLPKKEDSINMVAVVFKVIGEGVARFFRRLLGRA